MKESPGHRPMIEQPVLHTLRLILRAFVADDAADVRRLAGDRDVASTTATIPHPYPNGMAEAWIAAHRLKLEAGTDVVYAITLPGAGHGAGLTGPRSLFGLRSRARGREGEESAPPLLVGAIGLILNAVDRSAEMGYWIGKQYWGRGYATEAALGLLDYGFGMLGLERIHAHHMTRNPASGRVLEKAGMKFEREIAGGFLKWGKAEDIRVYAIARADRASGAAGGGIPADAHPDGHEPGGDRPVDDRPNRKTPDKRPASPARKRR